jgi:beta-galactosidase
MLLLGVAYYPEHWPQERWETDARMMQEAGISVARLAEFAWSRMEPALGRPELDWLDRAMDLLYKRGIRTVLCTPTAAAPAWLVQAEPDVLLQDQKGHPVSFGGRRHYCFNSESYRRHSDRIVWAMLERFANDERVAAWQTDNEFGHRCYCPRCAEAFRSWLKHKYGTTEKLNSAWGTIFWSQEYSDFSQVPPPLLGTGGNNPGLHLDYLRFFSDSIVSFQKRQIDLIRSADPKVSITHNTMTMSIYDDMDLYDLCADLDFASWDNYPMWTKDAVAPRSNAMVADYARSLKGKGMWIMEQQSGAGGSRAFGRFPSPGEIRLWTYQAVGRGADTIVYFRWRTARFGAEQYWHGILDHSGLPNRRYEEVKHVGREFSVLRDPLDTTSLRNRVAFLNTYDSRWALSIQPGNAKLDYFGHFEKYFSPLYRRGIGADFVNHRTDLTAYPLVVAPTLHLVSDELAATLTEYVKHGGTLVTTYRSGVKTVDNQVTDRPLPGPLAGLFGCTVEEYQNLEQMPGVEVTLGDELGGGIALSSVFNDVLTLDTARALGHYAGSHYSARPAIAINSLGKGTAIYVGFESEQGFYDTFVPWVLSRAGLPLPDLLPDSVEHTVRQTDTHRVHFWLNYADTERTVDIGEGGTDLLGKAPARGPIVLEPLGVLIVRETT